VSGRWLPEPTDPRPPAALDGGRPVTAALVAILLALCILVGMATNALL
jgi:hypothetical protein